MNKTSRSSAMLVTRLGECTKLWAESQGSHTNFIGEFEISLNKLRDIMKDDATPSQELSTLLDTCFYPKNKSSDDVTPISELYKQNKDTSVIFDPLLSAKLDWEDLRKLCTRTKHSSKKSQKNPTRDEMAVLQVEIRLALFANGELQRKLTEKLQEKQYEYSGGWIPFHTRVADFWEVAAEVCLGTKLLSQREDESPEVREKKKRDDDILDWIFLANDNNLTDYRQRIYGEFGENRNLLQKLYAIQECLTILTDLGAVQPPQEDTMKYKSVVVKIVDAIENLWSTAWPTGPIRNLLDSPLMKPTADKMNEIDRTIDPKGLLDEHFHSQGKISTDTQKVLKDIKDQTGAAIDSWTQFYINSGGKAIRDLIASASEMPKIDALKNEAGALIQQAASQPESPA